ncbi:MAG: Spy/CpxP family protein refolding chaperone [Planctomycetota bacterium]|nr:Spy/CpxP family protein refolding chaperone [Planctomycetota bacterium]
MWQVTAHAAAAGGGGGGGLSGGGGVGAGGGGAGGFNPVGGGGPRVVKPQKKAPFQKWILPQAVKAKPFLPKRIDTMLEGAGLSDAQATQVGALKDAIEKASAALISAQDNARASYASANDEATATACAQQVLAAAKEVEAYDPNKAYWAGLEQILTKEQWEKFSGQ